MAIALVASTIHGGPTQDTTTTDAINTTGANLIVISNGAFGDFPTISDSKSNIWVPLTAHTSGGYIQQLYYCVSPVTDSSHTFTAAKPGTFPSIGVLAFSVVKVADAFDQESAGATTSGTSIQPGSVTPDENNCLILLLYMFSYY